MKANTAKAVPPKSGNKSTAEAVAKPARNSITAKAVLSSAKRAPQHTTKGASSATKTAKAVAASSATKATKVATVDDVESYTYEYTDDETPPPLPPPPTPPPAKVVSVVDHDELSVDHDDESYTDSFCSDGESSDEESSDEESPPPPPPAAVPCYSFHRGDFPRLRNMVPARVQAAKAAVQVSSAAKAATPVGSAATGATSKSAAKPAAQATKPAPAKSAAKAAAPAAQAAESAADVDVPAAPVAKLRKRSRSSRRAVLLRPREEHPDDTTFQGREMLKQRGLTMCSFESLSNSQQRRYRRDYNRALTEHINEEEMCEWAEKEAERIVRYERDR